VTFWAMMKACYRESAAFMSACPLLFLMPVVVEFVQHAIEMHIGMYDSLAMAKQVEQHPLRMGFGFAKVIALIVPIYWVTRFIAFNRDAKAAARFDPDAVKLFTIFAALQIALTAIQLFAIPQSLGWLLGTMIVGQIFGALIAAWGVAAPLGNAKIGPVGSAQIMAKHVPYTVAFFILAMLPLMIPHYILGAAAIFAPVWAKWPILIMDSLLVGYLATVMIASGYFAAVRAAAKSGQLLLPR
jgi:hypothetical protein